MMNTETDIAKVHPVPGIRLGTASSDGGKENIAILEISEGSSIAAVFTQNAFAAAPVRIAKQHLQQTAADKRYCLINSGNANAATGAQGDTDCVELCSRLASIRNCATTSILPFSTGIIGQPLEVEQLAEALPVALHKLDENNWQSAAEAITTTDKFSKTSSCQWQDSQGNSITATGIAKGAGMICPNMATMLAFIACDASIPQQQLQDILDNATAESFNRISVDGDTSTNDAVLLIATGDDSDTQNNEQDLETCEQQITQLCQQLAYKIVSDGEGASKVIEISVQQASSMEEADMVARTVAHSPLVKTAFFGGDPNWGRIMAAVGRSGIAELNADDFHISINGIAVVTAGMADPELDYAQLAEQMRSAMEIKLEIMLGRGDDSDYVITCDLGHDYVSLNSEYSS